MTSTAYRSRLWLYLAAGILGYMVGDLKSLHLDQVAQDRIGFVLGAILAGVLISRAFIDRSGSEVVVEPAREKEKTLPELP